MLGIPVFEGSSCGTYVPHCALFSDNICLVYQGFLETLSTDWARVSSLSTVAPSCSIGRLVENLLVVPGYNTGHIGKAAVGNLGIISIEEFAEWTGSREVLVQQLHEGLSQVGRDFLIPWRMEPDDFPSPGFPATPGGS